MELKNIINIVLDEEKKDRKKPNRAKMCNVCGVKHKKGECRLGFDEVM